MDSDIEEFLLDHEYALGDECLPNFMQPTISSAAKVVDENASLRDISPDGRNIMKSFKNLPAWRSPGVCGLHPGQPMEVEEVRAAGRRDRSPGYIASPTKDDSRRSSIRYKSSPRGSPRGRPDSASPQHSASRGRSTSPQAASTSSFGALPLTPPPASRRSTRDVSRRSLSMGAVQVAIRGIREALSHSSEMAARIAAQVAGASAAMAKQMENANSFVNAMKAESLRRVTSEQNLPQLAGLTMDKSRPSMPDLTSNAQAGDRSHLVLSDLSVVTKPNGRSQPSNSDLGVTADVSPSPREPVIKRQKGSEAEAPVVVTLLSNGTTTDGSRKYGSLEHHSADRNGSPFGARAEVDKLPVSLVVSTTTAMSMDKGDTVLVEQGQMNGVHESFGSAASVKDAYPAPRAVSEARNAAALTTASVPTDAARLLSVGAAIGVTERSAAANLLPVSPELLREAYPAQQALLEAAQQERATAAAGTGSPERSTATSALPLSPEQLREAYPAQHALLEAAQQARTAAALVISAAEAVLSGKFSSRNVVPLSSDLLAGADGVAAIQLTDFARDSKAYKGLSVPVQTDPHVGAESGGASLQDRKRDDHQIAVKGLQETDPRSATPAIQTAPLMTADAGLTPTTSSFLSAPFAQDRLSGQNGLETEPKTAAGTSSSAISSGHSGVNEYHTPLASLLLPSIQLERSRSVPLRNSIATAADLPVKETQLNGSQLPSSPMPTPAAEALPSVLQEQTGAAPANTMSWPQNCECLQPQPGCTTVHKRTVTGWSTSAISADIDLSALEAQVNEIEQKLFPSGLGPSGYWELRSWAIKTGVAHPSPQATPQEAVTSPTPSPMVVHHNDTKTFHFPMVTQAIQHTGLEPLPEPLLINRLAERPVAEASIQLGTATEVVGRQDDMSRLSPEHSASSVNLTPMTPRVTLADSVSAYLNLGADHVISSGLGSMQDINNDVQSSCTHDMTNRVQSPGIQTMTKEAQNTCTQENTSGVQSPRAPDITNGLRSPRSPGITKGMRSPSVTKYTTILDSMPLSPRGPQPYTTLSISSNQSDQIVSSPVLISPVSRRGKDRDHEAYVSRSVQGNGSARHAGSYASIDAQHKSNTRRNGTNSTTTVRRSLPLNSLARVSLRSPIEQGKGNKAQPVSAKSSGRPEYRNPFASGLISPRYPMRPVDYTRSSPSDQDDRKGHELDAVDCADSGSADLEGTVILEASKAVGSKVSSSTGPSSASKVDDLQRACDGASEPEELRELHRLVKFRSALSMVDRVNLWGRVERALAASLGDTPSAPSP